MSGSRGIVGTQTLVRWGRRLRTADGWRRSTRDLGGSWADLTVRLTGSVDGAPRWAGGLVAGLQAAVLSLAVVVVPTVAAYVATSADPTNDDVGWLSAVALGSGLWLLGHGSPLDVGGVRVSLMPLGLTVLATFCCYASARRSGRPDRAGYAAGVGGYAALALVVALLSGSSGVLRAVLGGAGVAALGLGLGLLAQPGAPTLREVSAPVWRRVPGPVRVGAAAGTGALAALLLLAAGVVAAWVVGRWAAIAEVWTSLGVDVVGATVLMLTQAALVPDVVVWALAYVTGPGFAVGAGTHLAPAGVVAGPLPAVPLLGALPEPATVQPWEVWWPVVTVLAGAGAGWWLHTRLRADRWWHPLLACVTAAGAAGLGAAVLTGLAAGSAGPGRMAQVGASALLVGAAVAVGTLVGAAVVALPSDRELRREVSRRWSRVRAGQPWADRDGGSEAAPALPEPAPTTAGPDTEPGTGPLADPTTGDLVTGGSAPGRSATEDPATAEPAVVRSGSAPGGPADARVSRATGE